MHRYARALTVAAVGILFVGNRGDARDAAGPASLTLPVRLPVQLLQPAIREAFPVETDRENVWVDAKPLSNGSKLRFQIYFFRGNAKIVAQEGALEIAFDDVQYRLRAEVTPSSGRTVAGSCGYGSEWPRRARLAARAEIAWAEGWTFATRTRFAPPTLVDPCRLPDGTDLGPALEAGLADRLAATADAIDAAIAGQGAARQRFETFWAAIDLPVEIVSGTWLRLRPRGAVAGPIGGSGDTVEALVGLTVDPEVSFSAPAAGETPAPPALRLGAVPPPRLQMTLPIVATWDEVSRRLEAALVGTEIGIMGHTGLRIGSARASRQDSSIAVEMRVSGLVEGTAFVLARAELEPDGRALSLRDVTTRIEATGRLARAMTGVSEKALSAAIEKMGRIDLSDRFDLVRRGLSAAVNREIAPGVWLQGDVSNLHSSAFAIFDHGIETSLRFDADVRVEMR